MNMGRVIIGEYGQETRLKLRVDEIYLKSKN